MIMKTTHIEGVAFWILAMKPITSITAIHFVTQRVVAERLRQARCSFNLILVMSSLAACINLVGTLLLLLERTPEGIATATTGILTSLGCIHLAKNANDY